MQRVGSIVYATEQGLGILAKDFYDNGVVTDVVCVDRMIGSRPHREDWYPDAPVARRSGRSIHADILKLGRELVDRVDALLFFETPWEWELIGYAKERGKRTVLMPMYECMPKELPAIPDFICCPSLLDLQYYPPSRFRSAYIPVPVCSNWRLRERAEVFVHNAGHGGINHRNGTGLILDAWKHVKTPAKLILRSQIPLEWGAPTDPRIEVMVGTIRKDELYAEGDVFLFPEHNNGLSLPLQEAFASGMLVMATDRFPMNTWLPQSPLIAPVETRTASISPRCHEYQEAVIDPLSIAQMVDRWWRNDIDYFSMLGKQWAAQTSWGVLKSRYMDVLR